MIKDNLQHIAYYNYLTKGIQFGLKYLSETDFTTMENGKYEIVEGKLFAIVQDYQSKPIEEGKFEAHRKFIDIQFIVEGEEDVYVGELDNFEEITDYDDEKDIVFLTSKNNEEVKQVTLKEKEYLILTPKDVHMPSITHENSKHIKKVVLKVIV